MHMKNISSLKNSRIILFIVVSVLFLNSCSLSFDKRHYRKGYSMNLSSTTAKRGRASSEKITLLRSDADQPVEISRDQNPSSHPENSLQKIEKVLSLFIPAKGENAEKY